MSIFTQPVKANKPKTDLSAKMAILFAGILTIMTLAQLFTFEDFLLVLASYNLPFSAASSYFIGALLVSMGVFSLPFLLRMTVSHAFRWFSMICSWVVVAVWLKLVLWLAIVSPGVETVGFLGSLTQAPGWWALLFVVALVILAAWSSWGLWPAKLPRAHKKPIVK